MSEHDPRVEMEIGGVWTDVTADVYFDGGLSHTRGRSGEGATVDPATVGMTLKSPNGKYTPRLPTSPYFGLIGRNTPLRASTAGASTALYLPDASGITRASTPDTAALDITGDIDVRADITPATWQGQFINGAWEVMGKYGAVGQRSWRLIVRNSGQVEFAWFADASTLIIKVSTTPVQCSPRERTAIRATLDVNNGASGNTVTFYTAPTMAGPWTQLGDPVTTSGTTAIFNSNALVEIGDIATLGYDTQELLVHAAEVRSGIGGTLAANPIFSAQPVGATSFADSAGRTWTVDVGASITDRRRRFVVEIPSWSPRWSVSGLDMNVPIQGGGILRRLGQGAKALDSTLRRRIPSYSPLAYWPLEEGTAATQAYSPIAGVPPMQVTDVKFASNETLAGSSSLPVLGTNPRLSGVVPAGTPGSWHVEMVYNLETMPAALTQMFVIRTTGTAPRVYVHVQTNNVRLQGTNLDGDEVFLINMTAPAFTGAWNRLRVAATTSGSNVTYSVYWVTIGEGTVGLPTTIAGTAGRVTSFESRPGAGLEGMTIGHIAAFEAVTTAYDFADHGFTGETAGARAERLTAEEGVPFTLLGAAAEQEAMGPQRPDTLLNLLRQCEETDGGILHEDRSQLGLVYRGRATLYNQRPALTLTWDQVNQPFEPVDDDSRIRNDVTRSRAEGSSARVVREDGPLSVLPPPAGVGIYDESLSVSVETDEQLEQIAAWAVHRGTWDEARFRQVRILLHKHPDLIDGVTSLTEGSIVRITDTPTWLPPGPVDLMMEGYREDLTGLTWEALLACSPAGLWTVGVVEDPVLGRADTDGTVLAAAVSASQTGWPLTVTAGPAWITTAVLPAEFPFDVQAGGEVATVTAITGVAEDGFARTVASGWGSADSGQAWSLVGGSTSDYAVTGSIGRHNMTTVNVFRHSIAEVPIADVDLRMDVTVGALPVGDSAYVFPVVRYTDTTHLYFARVQISPAGVMTLTLRKRNGAEVQLGSAVVLGTTYTAMAWYTIRLAAVGPDLMVKCWPMASAEPAAWQIAASDSDLTAPGSIGFRTLLGASVSNIPITAAVNNVVCSPQQMTVTRAVNSISKSHAAGTDLRLAQPTIVAL